MSLSAGKRKLPDSFAQQEEGVHEQCNKKRPTEVEGQPETREEHSLGAGSQILPNINPPPHAVPDQVHISHQEKQELMQTRQKLGVDSYFMHLAPHPMSQEQQKRMQQVQKHTGNETVLDFMAVCLQAVKHQEQGLVTMLQSREDADAVQKYTYLVLTAWSLTKHLEMCINHYTEAVSDSYCADALNCMANRLKSFHEEQMFENQLGSWHWKWPNRVELWRMCTSENLPDLQRMVGEWRAIAEKLDTYTQYLSGEEQQKVTEAYKELMEKESEAFNFALNPMAYVIHI